MDYYKRWKEEENKAFQGWNFSHLEGRMIEEPLPWDYKNIVLEHLTDDIMLLDLGTGGGEFLLTLNHPYHMTSITEGYEPNFLLCKEKLAPLGIQVKQINEDGIIPYDDNSFDVVINRHESFIVEEVKRVLKPGGYFITQQVGNDNNWKLSKRLLGSNHNRVVYDNDVRTEIERLKNHGFHNEQSEEYYPKVMFKDIAALVYFAKIIEWEFPGFSVDSHYNTLIELQKELNQTGFIIGDEHRYLIVAKKEE